MSSSSSSSSCAFPSPSPPPPLDVVKNRWLGLLIWQSIAAATLFLPSSLLHRLLLRRSLLLPSASALAAFAFSFLAFHLALILLSLAFFSLSSAHPHRPAASLPALASGLVRASLRSLVGGPLRPSFDAEFFRRARRALASAAFLLICAAAGFLSAVAVGVGMGAADGTMVAVSGFRGLVFGLVYGIHYVYRKRWIILFPIIQRPLFYSFKMGLLSSFRCALKLSFQAFIYSSLLMFFMPDQFKRKSTVGLFILQQINFFIGLILSSFCWEMSHHLLQVIHTRRCSFAPPQGSAAAETNPSDILLETLEESPSRSLIQYLAYFDLFMVSETNVEPWRRAAFFEETGETYRKIVSACLKPLEHLTSRIAEALEGYAIDKSDVFSKQLNPVFDIQVYLREAFEDFQICSWSARTLSALTAQSRSEDRCGVAQLTGSNKVVLSTLLSCLLAVEASTGKKTITQPAHFVGPASIKWSTVSNGKGSSSSAVISKTRGGMLHVKKAYAMADVLRTSIYQLVSAFYNDLQANAKASILVKNWITEGKPIYGTHEILVQKLAMFIEYRAI